MGKLTSLPTKAPKDLDEDKVKKKTLKLSLEITKLLHNMSVQKHHPGFARHGCEWKGRRGQECFF